MSAHLINRHDMVTSRQRRQPADVPPISPLLLRLFTAYVRCYLQRALHVVRRS